MPRARKCGCNPARNGDLVFVGPGEGREHKEAVTQAVQSWNQLRPPDLVLRSPHDNMNVQYVMKSDLCREAPRFQQLFQANPSIKELILDDDDVTTQHLGKVADFLFTGDYAVDRSDVLTYDGDMVRRKAKCNMCNNHYRLLSIHLDMFLAGRSLGMELLQLLAMHKFAEAADSASGPVLKHIIEDLYSLEPPRDEFGSGFGIAGFLDFRPLMIIPAVLHYIQRNKPQVDWLRAFRCAGGAFMVNPAQKPVHHPVDEFRDVREWYPAFHKDLTRGLQVAML